MPERPTSDMTTTFKSMKSSSEELNVVLSKIHEIDSKYVYFLLAVAASAIAYTVKSTQSNATVLDILCLMVTVVFWGASFFWGCKTLSTIRNIQIKEYEFTKEIEGYQDVIDKKKRKEKRYLSSKKDEPFDINDYMEKSGMNDLNSYFIKLCQLKVDYFNKEAKYFDMFDWQFKLLSAGGAFYIIWQVGMMFYHAINRTDPSWLDMSIKINGL
ncbi:MAG: hypothetical protein COA78_36235 [Blastopirellula sp.]|nr:MAG: hypothetical protein COA78_36235 [Blastopirellula sp.]